MPSGIHSSGVHRARRALVLGCIAAIALTAAACQPQTSSGTPTIPTIPTDPSATIWALGDSQGAISSDPARGLPWTLRLGSDVANGATSMEGAGWTVPGTFTGKTVPQRAADIGTVNSVTRFISMAGINDLSAGATVAQMQTGVAALDAFGSAHGVRVTYVSLVPFPQGNAIAARNADRLAFNAAVAAAHPGNFINCESALANASGWLDTAYSLSPSNFHLNSAGEQKLADCINSRR